MYYKLISDPIFFLMLLKFDRNLAIEIHSQCCPYCGGKLDWANYMRQPRGGPETADEYTNLRFSFCCRVCRQRTMPASLRFLGRRVYFSVVFALITAMSHGVSAKRVAELRQAIGVSRQTLVRWRIWWKETFPQTAFWKEIVGRFARPVDTAKLPGSLIECFEKAYKDLSKAICKFLEFISPLSHVC
jgi:hypothetical protein